jgi:hypothetical protein
MEYGIAVYLRDLSARLTDVARNCPDAHTHEAIVAICFDLADKAHVIESTFTVPKQRRVDRFGQGKAREVPIADIDDYAGFQPINASIARNPKT